MAVAAAAMCSETSALAVPGPNGAFVAVEKSSTPAASTVTILRKTDELEPMSEPRVASA